MPPRALRLGDHVVDERRLARRLRAEDLDDAAARQPADAEREVERERAGRDRADGDCRVIAHLHDRALAELPLDLPERDVECFCSDPPHDLLGQPFPEPRTAPRPGAAVTDKQRRRTERTFPGSAAPAAAPGRRAEARHGDVRKPGTALAAVDAEPLEPLLDGSATAVRARPRRRRRASRRSASRGTGRGERRSAAAPAAASRSASHDRVELARRAVAEEGEREMEMVPRRRRARRAGGRRCQASIPSSARPGRRKREEEPEPFIAAHASGRGHTASSRLRVRSAPDEMERADGRARADRGPGRRGS